MPELEWLRAQLGEDERVARASQQEPYHFYADGHYGAVREFLALWDPVDPVRVLALVEALRTLLDRFEQDDANAGLNAVVGNHATGQLTAIRLLSEALYGDRPDYPDRLRP